MRVLPWLFVAGLAVIGGGVPAVAQACTCGPAVGPAAIEGPYPANGLVVVTSCGDDLPVEQLGVQVDGQAAELVDAGIEVGPYAALLRITPAPADGQTVTFDAGLSEGEAWPFVYGPTEWVVGPADDTPPTASATVEVVLGDKQSDGLACPPFGPYFSVVLSDLVLDDEVAFIRAELVREGVVTAASLLEWDASAWPAGTPLALDVFAETDGEACLQAFAMDRAGNETRLGTSACEVDPVMVEDDEDVADAEAELDARGCGCTSTGASGWWGLGLLGVVVVGLGGRRRRAAG